MPTGKQATVHLPNAQIAGGVAGIGSAANPATVPGTPNTTTIQPGAQTNIYRVGASYYGGPTDPSSGHTGYRGDVLDGKMAYAELGMGTLLGGLAHGQPLLIGYNGKWVQATKLDIGLGGSPIIAPYGNPPKAHSFARRIDLWYELAQALGFNGTGVVDIRLPNNAPMHLPGGAVTVNAAQAGGPLQSGILDVTPGGETVKGAANAVAGGFTSVADFLSSWFSQAGLLRIAKIAGGATLIAYGVHGLITQSGAPRAKLPIPV